MSYDPITIEPKWQKYWEDNKTFKVSIQKNKKKYYALDMFPYPSSQGLHVGHPEGYTATDIVSRYKRMMGFNVLHCMGWDAFGLPAEQYAIQTGTHPAITTKQNVDRFRQQIKSLGFSYDWDREINTTDKNYYKWTQWIFIQLFKKDLAKVQDEMVNWCPELGTVLANEEIIDGKTERGGFPVEKKKMRQWILKITEYADRLLDGLEGLDWSDSIKEMQRNWIGKSYGATVTFTISDMEASFDIFTTRPDTLFGATYCVLSPEHSLVEQISKKSNLENVLAYKKIAASKSDLERTELLKEKTGVFTGSYAINPVNNQEVPIWIADYVLHNYGTGAIMAVPAHDERDYEFAKKLELPIIEVISGGKISEEAFVGKGVVINSDFLNNLPIDQAKKSIISWLTKKGLGKGSVNYKLRDWLFARQRYWGEPFPVLMDEKGNPHVVEDSELPVTLPEVENYLPSGTGESPLAKIEDWIHYIKKDGSKWTRDSNTMPQWAGSCWYYLRFTDPRNDQEAWSKEAEKYWMPVDLYVGGAEHAVLHLLYARFWHKVLFDLGYVHTEEPFQKLVNQGMILGADGQKMSKSIGNVVNPEEIIESHGADAMRLYEMFMGPLEKDKPWQTNGIEGVYRFLARVWKLIVDDKNQISSKIHSGKASLDELKLLHQTIKKITDCLEKLRFNTAISQMMVFLNEISNLEVCKKSMESFVLILSPFAPHLCEELWERLGHKSSLAYQTWPSYDEKHTKVNEVKIPIQINGKVRDQIQVDLDISEEKIVSLAKNSAKIKKYLCDKSIKKVIFVKRKILNLVVQ